MKICYSKSLEKFVAAEIQEDKWVVLVESDSLNDVLSQVGMMEKEDANDQEESE